MLFRYYYKEFGYQNVSNENFVNDLPYTLKAQLMLTIHAKIIIKVPFFMGREIDLILNIVPELKSMSCDAYEFIYFEDDFAEQIFFVNEGFLSLKTKNGNTFMSFASGDMIGDVEIIFNVKYKPLI